MRDERFIRGKVPMTKSEIRAVSLSKLELSEDSVCYDIGAGTGSVAVEMALAAPAGHVYAVERKAEAVELIVRNREKFGVSNMTVVEGTAPQAFRELPPPTHAFIGGTAGELSGILELLLQKNPQVRVVINVIALESLAAVMSCLEAYKIPADVVTVQVSKADRVGGYHLMKGMNPVTVISFGGEELADEEH